MGVVERSWAKDSYGCGQLLGVLRSSYRTIDGCLGCMGVLAQRARSCSEATPGPLASSQCGHERAEEARQQAVYGRRLRRAAGLYSPRHPVRYVSSTCVPPYRLPGAPKGKQPLPQRQPPQLKRAILCVHHPQASGTKRSCGLESIRCKARRGTLEGPTKGPTRIRTRVLPWFCSTVHQGGSPPLRCCRIGRASGTPTGCSLRR